MTASPDVPAPDRPARDLAGSGARSAGRPSRAGRDLGSAIAVGLALGAIILVPLLTVRQTFVGVLAAATAVATWELRDALRRGAGIEVPLPVLLVGGQAMIWLSWPFGLRGLALAFVATALGCLVWRMRAGAAHYLRDVSAGLFTAVYVPLFCAFAAMLTVAPDGVGRVLTFMLCVVASDVGGYAIGVLAGKHPMAPTISPKKSWEGFAGSQVAGMITGALTRLAAARRAVVGGGADRGAARGQRDARRSGRVADQARPRDQGHGPPAARPRRPHGPPRLDAAHGRRVLFRARPDRPVPVTRAFRRAAAAATPRDRPIPSPNIWNWPDVYEWENRAQDVHGAVWAALREAVPWQGRDVLDVGCGDGFHLPLFTGAASVSGVEPHAPLVARARTRLADRRDIRVFQAGAAALPLPDASVDLVHARTAYFFGRGCEPGLAEAERVLRPGGAIAIVDLDATVPPYGAWMRADLPRYDPAAAEAFFTDRGFTLRRIPTVWRFPDRATRDAVLRIEFSRDVAERAIAATAGLEIAVGYRLHVRRPP